MDRVAPGLITTPAIQFNTTRNTPPKKPVEHDDTLPAFHTASSPSQHAMPEEHNPDHLNTPEKTLNSRTLTTHDQPPLLTVKENNQSQTAARATEPEGIEHCCQQWLTSSGSFPDQMTLPELEQLCRLFKKALITRSIADRQQDSPATMVNSFFLGALIMTHNKLFQMRVHSSPDISNLNPDKRSCSKVFSDHTAWKLDTVFNHPELHDRLTGQGISYGKHNFFVPNDVFQNTELTSQFIPSLFSTLCEFYQPPATLETGSKQGSVDLMHSTPPSIVRLFKLLGYWRASGNTLMIIRGFTRHNEIAPVKLIDALKNTASETHPFHPILIQSQLDTTSKVKQFESTPDIQKKNFARFAELLKKDRTSATHGADRQAIKTTHRRQRQNTVSPPAHRSAPCPTAKEKHPAPSSTVTIRETTCLPLQKPSSTPYPPDLPTPVTELADTSTQPSLARQLNRLIKNNNLPELKQLISQHWPDVSSLRPRQQKKIANFLKEQDPQYFQTVQTRLA